VERYEAHGLASTQELASRMSESWISSSVVNHFVIHEGAHSAEDEIGYGEFGFVVLWNNEGWGSIMAYYRPLGERSAEQMAKIAKAPGFSEMSEQDLHIYNLYQAIYLKEEQDKKIEKEIKFNQVKNEKLAEVEEEVKKFTLPWLIKKPEGIEGLSAADMSDRITRLFVVKVKLNILFGILKDPSRIDEVNPSEYIKSQVTLLKGLIGQTLNELGLDNKREVEDEGTY